MTYDKYKIKNERLWGFPVYFLNKLGCIPWINYMSVVGAEIK